MTDSEKLYQWVENYNWDDGFGPIWPIVESRETEFATALLIYWRLEGPWLKDCSNDEAQRLHDTVESRLLAGFYPVGTLRYFPELTKTQVYKFTKAGVPRILIQPDYSNKPGG